MSKYDPLRIFLENAAKGVSEMTLTFQQIETILGFTLPPSARRHRAWWANPGTPHDHPHAHGHAHANSLNSSRERNWEYQLPIWAGIGLRLPGNPDGGGDGRDPRTQPEQ